MLSQVMQPWTAAISVGLNRHAEADLLGQLGEGVSRCPSFNSSPALGEEERGSGWCRKEAISRFGILFQCDHGRGMNRHVTRFSPLSPPDVKDAAIEVDIRSVQTQGFANPHPGHRQQTEKSRKRAGTKSLGRGKLLGLAKEPFDLLVAIDVGRLASVSMREKFCGWNLGARFRGAVPAGEAPDHTQTLSRGRR